MPTPSSHYSDLEYATVNQDGDTWGVITNNYINGLLTKLRDLEDRVIVAEGQLTTINASVDPVNKMNTTLASALQGKAVLSGTTTTLSPDPYSGNYTTATTWPAYGAAELASISVPTTLSEVQNFSYENFANALSPILTAIEAKVNQATADVSAARIDICKTKKLLDAFNAGGTTVRSSETVFFTVNGIGQFVNVASYDYHSSSYSSGNLTVNYTLNSSTNGVTAGQTAAEAHQTFVTEGMLANGSATTVYANESAAQSGLSVNTVYMHLYQHLSLFPLTTSSAEILSNSYEITWYPTTSTFQLSVTAPAQSTFSSWSSNVGLFSIRKRKVIESVVYGIPDVSSCDTSPGGPHFIT